MNKRKGFGENVLERLKRLKELLYNKIYFRNQIINENEFVLPVPGSHVVADGIGGKEKL